MKRYINFIIPIIAVILCCSFFLTSADNKINDLFLRCIPSLKENKNVILMNIDDTSIEQVGSFPWTRDVIADALVFMHEMGTQQVVFDLNYLDKSPDVINPNYIRNDLPNYLNFGFKQINSNIEQVMDGFSAGAISRKDAPDYKDQLLSVTDSVKNQIDNSVSYVARDIDAYFAQNLKAFGSAFLTLTMISPDEIIGDDKSYTMKEDELKYLEENIALKNITVKNDTKTPEFIGIAPAILSLLRSAKAAGFVNANPDQDGYRRRLHLVAKYNGKYYGQLVFVPLLSRLGNPEVVVSNSEIVLKNANLNGTVKDITIPRCEDGTVLINWPQKRYEEYNSISAWDIIKNDKLETALVTNLNSMDESGFFSYWDQDESPIEKYSQAAYIRDELAKGEDSESGITFEQYKEFRNSFFDMTDIFLNKGYEENIINDVSGDPETVEYVKTFFTKTREQFTNLLEIRKLTHEKLNNAFCIIGTTATSTTDEGLITFQERFPNVGTHYSMANMILSEEFIDDSPRIISIIIAFILSFFVAFISIKSDTKKLMLTGITTLLVSVGFLLLSWIITKKYVGAVVPFASVAITFITLSVLGFFTTLREKSFLRSAFSRYLSPEVINEIINDPSMLNLGGEKREMTALFTDIRGFSTISEGLDPVELVNLLNKYLTNMSDIILQHRGTIDKYEGDAIIAFFGAPIQMENHAALACRSALLMKAAEKTLNEELAGTDLLPFPIFTRIGINTGDMVVGNMGTANKMDYTMIGNAVNLAARLEGVNKQYNTRGILISEHTKNQIGNQFLVRPLDRVRVVGVETPLRLYELLDEQSNANGFQMEQVAKWEKGIDLYESRNFENAKAIFNEILTNDTEDKVATLYIERCNNFIINKPDDNWDGVFNLTQK